MSRCILKPSENSLITLADEHTEKEVLAFVTDSDGRKVRSLTCCYTTIWLSDREAELFERQITSCCEEFAKNRLSEIDLSNLLNRELGEKLQTILTSAGWIGSHVYHKSVNWSLEVDDGGFDSYLEKRPSHLKNTVRRKRQKLSKEADWAIRISREPSEVALDLVNFHEVYAKSWKPEEEYPRFLEYFFAHLAAEGRLRTGILFVDNRPVAAQVWIVEDNKAYIFKLAHITSLDKYSPGTLLTFEMFKHMISIEKVFKIDFLYGSDSYKADWMAERREIVGVHAFNPMTVRGILSFLAYKLRTISKYSLTLAGNLWSS